MLGFRSVPIDDDRSLAEILSAFSHEERFAFIKGGEGIIGSGVASSIDIGTGPDRFLRAQSLLERATAHVDVTDEVGAFGSGIVAFGSFAFDEEGAPSRLVIPEVIVGRRNGVTWSTTVQDFRRPARSAAASTAAPQQLGARANAHPDAWDRPRFAGTSLPDTDWLLAVDAALRLIESGALDKVVLARDHLMWSRTAFDLDSIVRTLAGRFPDCFTFRVDGLVGASPELLLRSEGTAITSQVLAGTTRRGANSSEDEALAAALLSSDKERREHAFAAESVRAVLSPLASDLKHAVEPELLRLDNLQHLATRFSGTLDTPEGSLSLLARLHPTAAVGGAPRAEAIAAIRALERLDRGRYAAPVGWTTPSGDGEWAIALRCGEFEETRARLFAGAGIVAGSLPEQELMETWLKLRTMQDTIGSRA